MAALTNLAYLNLTSNSLNGSRADDDMHYSFWVYLLGLIPGNIWLLPYLLSLGLSSNSLNGIMLLSVILAIV